MKLLLVDLSSLFRPIWEMRLKEADTDWPSKTTVARVHDMANGYDGVAVCCDSRKSWRKELAPTYKANRPASEEPMLHQLRLAQETLKDDGFPVWQAEGFEADDVIASAVNGVLATSKADRHELASVVVASNDKDMMQLVQVTDSGDTVVVKSLRSGTEYDVAAVVDKFGVFPHQMRDLLSLWGDTVDGVKGIDGIGQKKGAELLKKHGSLTNLYATLGDSCTALDLTPNMFTKLKEGEQTAALAWKLVGLRTDVELPFADIFKPRAPKAPAAELEDTMGEIIDGETGEVTNEPEPAKSNVVTIGEPPLERAIREHVQAKSAAMVPVEWSQTLEPTNLSQAMNLAKAIFASRQFAAYGTPEAVLMAIMTGRELNISTMAALRSIHIIEGKPTLSADLMAALVLRSGKAKQFEVIERTNDRATVRCWREGEEKPIDVTYSVDDAKRAGRVKPGSGWEKNPADMCVARCKAIGARLKWPDVIANMYTADELGREEAA